jgi:hypothetical protein
VQYFSGAAPAIGPAARGWQFAFPDQPNHVDYVTAPVSMNISAITGSTPLFDYHTASDNKCGPAALEAQSSCSSRRLAMTSQAGPVGVLSLVLHTADNVLKVGPGTTSVALNPSLWASLFANFNLESFAVQ